ncbi:MAG: thiamine phosphate synthase, partial [Spirochaetes bacterium]|nr:thiamine phosphate synthase [Spirochaetota bacterium]
MNASHAAIDANINRAMEGLRVCEDICRFVLHDEMLSRTAKKYRHSIAEHASQWKRIELLSSRDVIAVSYTHL